MPILSTILLTANGAELDVWGTDLELGFKQKVPGDVLEEGSITISGRKLFEILRESRKESVHIKDKENNWVHISDEVARFDLACLPADEFPAFVEPEGVVMVTVDGEMLSEMINKTIYAVTVEEAGFKLSGVFTEKVEQEGEILFRMVSTDGHRLSMIDKSLSNVEALAIGSGVMIPKKGISELGKLCSEGGRVEIGFKDKTFVAKKEEALLVIRLLEAKFPDYHAVIPKEERFSFQVDRMSLLEAMRKMLILSNDRYRAVKIALENDTMELVSTNPDLGEAQENIRIEYSGERLEAGFNPRYFIDTLQALDSDIVKLSFIEESKPCLIRGDSDGGFLGLIMPMRL
jgi:DNA polymerase-3 subunit beta